MLDHYLEIAYQADERQSVRNQMADGFKNLPVDELKKIASGELKLAGYDDDNWLCKFRGTPFYDDALQLETQCLELDAQQQKMNLEESSERRERTSARDALWDAKDAIRLKKRLLELDLRKAELEAETGMEDESSVEEMQESPEEEAEEEVPEDVEEEEEDDDDFPPELKEASARMAKFAKAGRERRRSKEEKAGEKQASADDAMQVADFWGRQMAHISEMDKDAGLGSTVLEGLKGAGGAIKNLATRGATVYQKGGGEGLQKALMRGGKQAVQRGSQWAAENPAAAGAIGAGALGTAALGGAGLGAVAT